MLFVQTVTVYNIIILYIYKYNYIIILIIYSIENL